MAGHGFWGVTLGSIHTYDDWGLYMLDKPTIEAAEVKSMYEDIPGVDGQLDLTETLDNTVHYGLMDISFELHMLNDAGWASIYSKIMNYCHGKTLRVVFDDDAEHYYTGRLTVKGWKSSRGHGVVTISGKVKEYNV